MTSWNSSPPFGHFSGNCCNSLISYPFPGYPPQITNPNLISAEEHVVFADLTTKDLEKFDTNMKAYQRKKLDKEILGLHASGKISDIYVCNAPISASNANVDGTPVGASLSTTFSGSPSTNADQQVLLSSTNNDNEIDHLTILFSALALDDCHLDGSYPIKQNMDVSSASENSRKQVCVVASSPPASSDITTADTVLAPQTNCIHISDSFFVGSGHVSFGNLYAKNVSKSDKNPAFVNCVVGDASQSLFGVTQGDVSALYGSVEPVFTAPLAVDTFGFSASASGFDSFGGLASANHFESFLCAPSLPSNGNIYGVVSTMCDFSSSSVAGLTGTNAIESVSSVAPTTSNMLGPVFAASDIANVANYDEFVASGINSAEAVFESTAFSIPAVVSSGVSVFVSAATCSSNLPAESTVSLPVSSRGRPRRRPKTPAGHYLALTKKNVKFTVEQVAKLEASDDGDKEFLDELNAIMDSEEFNRE